MYLTNFLISPKLFVPISKIEYCEFKFKPRDTILFGRESEGVPENVHKNAYERLKIPLKNNARSLNISVAAAITLAEAEKQNYLKND